MKQVIGHMLDGSPLYNLPHHWTQRERAKLKGVPEMSHELIRHLQNSTDPRAAHFAIAHGLFAIAESLDRLGNADASTPMGAIEMFGKHIGEKLDALTDAIVGLTTGE